MFIVLLLTAGCAKVGDPLPQVVQRPATIQNLEVEEQAGRVRFRFTVPERVEWVEFFRQCAPTNTRRSILIGRIHWNELSEGDLPDQFVQEFATIEGPDCRYAIRFVDRWAQSSEFSNLVQPRKNP